MSPQLLQDSLEELISKEAINTHLQPIVDLSRNEVLGFEALTRGDPTHMLQRPDLMFQAANQFDLVPQLESLCIRTAVAHFSRFCISGRLFLNICPQTLFHFADTLDELTSHLQVVELTPRDVVLEISERFPIEHADRFVELINRLKKLGYGIAIDDLGSGYSGLKLWSQIRPDYVKIDRHFIDRIDQDPVKQAFVTSVVHLCDQLKCEVIAEGIERLGEVKLLRSLGIHIGQGYLLGKPASEPGFIPLDASRNDCSIQGQGLDLPIGFLAQQTDTIATETLLKEAESLFNNRPQLMSIPVLHDNRPIGLLHQRKVLETFAQPYGRALFERKKVDELMQRNPLIVDRSMSIESVSHLVTEDEDHYLRQHLIVTDDGNYCGMVNTKELLRRITNSQIQKARYANPLTMLPGNVLIDEHIDGLLVRHKPFCLMYADLNHFKPFNDHYGYRQGDNVIRWLGQLLQSVSTDSVFVGHVGGDDFILVSDESEVSGLCAEVLALFESGIAAFHKEEDWKAGYIRGTDRNGRPSTFPLLSLAIGVVPSELIIDEDAQTLARLAADAKKVAKKNGGNHWQVLNRY